jgi:hypothetical protein
MVFGSMRSLALVSAIAWAAALFACGESERGGRGGDAGDGNDSGGSSGNPSANAYVTELRTRGVDKVDLLLMIDNSISMGNKQELLAEAVPVLLQRLIQPLCVNATGQVTGSQPCPSGTVPEFRAIENIHIGVITSSLGHHGSYDVCSENSGGRTPDDKAQLLPSVRTAEALTSWNDQGFLVWDPRGSDGAIADPHVPPGWGAPGGPGDATGLLDAFTDQVRAVGELGCGYEQQLEAWYRFLVDPEPVLDMDNDGLNSVRPKDPSGKTIVNQVVLDQRATFLRRDSLLVIVMLTDENDCSILDEDGMAGWLVGFKGGVQVNNWRMPAATNSCRVDPNHECCRPCIVAPSAACGDNSAEGCPESGYLSIAEDSMNQRCHRQLERFGLDLLYPTQRYVEAITQPLIDPRMTGSASTPNPLFAPGPSGERGREAGLVLLAGIVGVPWQDVATDGQVPVAAGEPQPPNSLSPGRDLVYLTADQLDSMGRWDVILGDPSARPPIPPSDPLMIESIDPRMTGAPHPLGYPGAAIAAPGTAGNSINGAEQAVNPATRDDLQFACIFDLPTPMICDATNAAGCDCNAEDSIKNSPLCNYSAPETDGQQIKAKAYPSLRELEVLRGVGSAGIVASICPKNPTSDVGDPADDPNYGYNPAVAAIVGRAKEAFRAKCLPRPLDVVSVEHVDSGSADPEDLGQVPCFVVEARLAVSGTCAECGAGRAPLVGTRLALVPAIQDYMRNMGRCDGQALLDCDDYCYCEIQQFTGQELLECLTSGAVAGNLNGYCYVDPEQAAENALYDGVISTSEQDMIALESALVASCKETERRVLRFLGSNVPARDSLAFLSCSPGGM